MAKTGTGTDALADSTAPEELRMDFRENAYDSIRRSLLHASNAASDPREWKFAILGLSHGIELLLKAGLYEAHPLLIFVDVDKPQRTLGAQAALERLKNGLRKQVQLKDERYVKYVFDLRNTISHAGFTLTLAQLRTNYFHVLTWLNQLHKELFGRPLSNESMNGAWKILLGHEEFVNRTLARLKTLQKEGKFAGPTLQCRKCGQDTFFLAENVDTCYLCGYFDIVNECSKCSKADFADNFFETDEGNMRGLEFLQDYCVDCFRKYLKGSRLFARIQYVPNKFEAEYEAAEHEATFGYPEE